MKAQITDILNIKYPIIQAPMSWLTSAELVASVSNAGGLGVLGANAGQHSITSSVEETKERMRREIHKTKSLTGKPFALNILFGRDMSYSRPLIDLAIEEGVATLAVVLIDDVDYSDTLKEIQSHGIKVLLRPATPTIENARQAEQRGVDIYVATGYDSGGVSPSSQIGTFSILPMIADVLEHTPLLAAGGIGDVRGVRAALALGADGVYVGTAFMAVEENPLAPSVKELMLTTGAEQLHTFRATMGTLRSLPTALTQELVEMNRQGFSPEEVTKKIFEHKSAHSGLITGDINMEYVNAGLSVGLVKQRQTAEELIQDLMQDFIMN